MAVEATAATMRVIATALFSGDERLTTPEAMEHITAAMEGVGEARLQALLGLPMLPVTPRGRRGRAGSSFCGVRSERSSASGLGDSAPDDFVTAMIHALLDRFPREEAIELAVDNAATFYLAGHETTANLTSWTLFLLTEQPELQDKVAAEAETALGRGCGRRAAGPAAAAARCGRGIAAALSAGAALRPRGGRRRPARRA